MFTYKGEKVLDPFAGSFTSPKVAAELGRVGIGIELNKKMFGKSIMNKLTSDENNLFGSKLSIEEFSLLKEKKENRQI